jgi:cell division control protein 6
LPSVEKIIEDEISSPSVFKEKHKLYPEYTPSSLPHREKQLKQLAQLFKSFFSSPGEEMQRVMLVGSFGTGKTVTSKLFGASASSLASRNGIRLKYVHVNCYKSRTLPQIIYNISLDLGITLPQRGLSAQELMRGLIEELERRNTYAIVALDEFDYFALMSSGLNSIYVLVRAYDEYVNKKKRLHFIFISRSISTLENIDPSSSTYFLKNIVEFSPYTYSELYDILKERADEALYPGVISDDELKYISMIEGYDKGGSGSARTALEILVRAGESADSEKRSSITLDDIRKAHVIVKPELAMLQDQVSALDRHELVLYLSVIKALKGSGSGFVRIGDVEKIYRVLCEAYNLQPRRHTQVYTHILELRSMGFIQTKSSGKGFRGKSTLIGISAAPLYVLESKVEELLKRE